MLGANGAGKTTLMRAMLGLVPPRAGAIRVLGRAGDARQRGDRLHAAERAAASPACGSPAGISSPARRAAALGPAAPRRGDARARSTGRSTRSARATGPPAARRTLRRRAPAAAASPGPARPAEAAAARRAPDQPRSRPSAQRGRARRAAARRVGIAVLFSAHELNPLLNAIDRVLYLGGGQAALARSTRSSPGRCCRGSTAPPIEVVRVTAASS